MSRNPSEQFVHHYNWYIPSAETSKDYAVYWGRLVNRRLIRTMLLLILATLVLAALSIILAVYAGRPWYAPFDTFYICGLVLTVGAQIWGIRLAHDLGRNAAARDHRMYQDTLSMEPDILKDSPMAKFVPTRIP